MSQLTLFLSSGSPSDSPSQHTEPQRMPTPFERAQQHLAHRGIHIEAPGIYPLPWAPKWVYRVTKDGLWLESEHHGSQRLF